MSIIHVRISSEQETWLTGRLFIALLSLLNNLLPCSLEFSLSQFQVIGGSHETVHIGLVRVLCEIVQIHLRVLISLGHKSRLHQLTNFQISLLNSLSKHLLDGHLGSYRLLFHLGLWRRSLVSLQLL